MCHDAGVPIVVLSGGEKMALLSFALIVATTITSKFWNVLDTGRRCVGYG
jgi:pyruvate-formate lyase-activating enzyme